MCSTFSCLLKYSEAGKENVAVFQSDSLEEYRVKYRSNVCRDLLLNIKWTVPKEVLITVKLYSKTCKRFLCSKGCVVNGTKMFTKLRGAFNKSSSRNSIVICSISVIPFVKFKKNKETFEIDSRQLSPEGSNSKNMSMLSDIEIEYPAINGNSNATSYDKILNENETKVESVVLLKDDSINIAPVTAVKLRDVVWDKNNLPTDDLNATVMYNNDYETVKSEHAIVCPDQKCLLDSCNLEDDTDKEISITDVNIIRSAASHISEKMSSSIDTVLQDKSMGKIPLVDLDEKVFINLDNDDELLTSKQISTKDSIMDIESPNLSMERQSHTFHDLVEESSNESQNDAHKLLALNNCSTRNCLPMKTEIEDLFSEKVEAISSENMNNAFVNNSNMEINSKLAPRKSVLHSSVEFETSGNLRNQKRSFHDICDVTKRKKQKNISKILSLNDFSSKTDAAMKIDSQVLTIYKDTDFESANIENTVIKSSDMEARVLKSGDLSPKMHSVLEFQLTKQKHTSVDLDVEVISNFVDNNCELVTSTDIFAESYQARETNFQKFEKLSSSISNVVDSAVSINPDKAIKLLEVNDISKSTDSFIDIHLPGLSENKCDFIASDLNQDVNNNADLTVHQPESKGVSKKSVSDERRSECSPVVIHQLPEGVMDGVTKRNVCKSIPSEYLSEECNSVFESQFHKISSNKSNTTLLDTNSTVVENTHTQTFKSTDSDGKTFKEFPIMENDPSGLSMNLLDLLMSGDMADIVITNGEKEMNVHKAILSCRSSVFKNLLSCSENENNKSCVNVDIPSHIMEDLIVFMYAGVISIKSASMAEDLYYAAKKYRIADLLHICSKYISK